MFPAQAQGDNSGGSGSSGEAHAVPSGQPSQVYWVDTNEAGGVGQPTHVSMTRPSPSVSNCGLVIVQVDSSTEKHQAGMQEDSSYTTAKVTTAVDGSAYQPPAQVIQHWQQPYPEMGSSAAHQLIHGLPPPMSGQIILNAVEGEEIINEEVGEDEEEEEEEEEGEVSDEGYRTHSSREASPRSTTSGEESATETSGESSSSVKGGEKRPTAKRALIQVGAGGRENGGVKNTGIAQEAGNSNNVATNNSEKLQQQGQSSKGEQGKEEGNLMWLLDFKLDFFNEANGGGMGPFPAGSNLQQQQQQLQQQIQMNAAAAAAAAAAAPQQEAIGTTPGDKEPSGGQGRFLSVPIS